MRMPLKTAGRQGEKNPGVARSMLRRADRRAPGVTRPNSHTLTGMRICSAPAGAAAGGGKRANTFQVLEIFRGVFPRIGRKQPESSKAWKKQPPGFQALENRRLTAAGRGCYTITVNNTSAILNAAGPRGGRIQAVDRALAILERVARAPEGLALRDLAAALGLGPTTVHNLAATLVARGYLAKTTAPKRYVLAAAARALAAAGGQQALEQRVATALRGLAARWPQATITVAQPLGREIVTHLRRSPEQGGALQRPAHLVLPPYTSASALVFEAFWNDAERAAYQQQFPFAEYGRGFWGKLARHENFLAQIRRRGHAVLDLKDGRLRAAAPVFDEAGTIRFALGVALPTPKPSVQARLVRDLERTAQGR